MAKKPTQPTPATLPQGQVTPKQFGRVRTAFADMQGWGDVQCGEYNTYREMRTCPTVAIARAAAMAPVKAAGWFVEATDNDDGKYDEVVDFVQRAIEPVAGDLVRNSLYAWDYGWQGAEIVWGVREGRVVPERLNFLKVDDTKILTDEQGTVTGLKQKQFEVPESKTYIYTYDGECGDPYGRSRMENIREHAWRPWRETINKLGKYISKHAGVISTMRYPVGEGQIGLTGATFANEEIAAATLQNLGKGAGVAFPVTFEPWQAEAIRAGASFDSLTWNIGFLEPSSGAGGEMMSFAKYCDSLICRGLLVPERAILEGQHGTKAEAESQGDVAVEIAEEENQLIWEGIQRQIVYRMVLANFGRAAAEAVRVKAAPLSEPEKRLAARIIETVFTNPANADLLLSMLDLDAMLDTVKLPKAKETVDQTETRPELETVVEGDPAPLAQTLSAALARLSQRKQLAEAIT